MMFFVIISAVSNLLTALAVVAHFLHSVWKSRRLRVYATACLSRSENVQTEELSSDGRASVSDEAYQDPWVREEEGVQA